MQEQERLASIEAEINEIQVKIDHLLMRRAELKQARRSLKRTLAVADEEPAAKAKQPAKEVNSENFRSRVKQTRLRNSQILDAYDSGLTKKELADKYGLTLNNIGIIILNQRRRKEREETTQLIGDLELSVYSSNALFNAGVRTVSDLIRLSQGDLLRLKKIGRFSMLEITAELQKRGLSLAT